MRIRITIEYDPDKPEDMTDLYCFKQEQEAWRSDNVSVSDIEAIGEPIGTVKWEIIP